MSEEKRFMRDVTGQEIARHTKAMSKYLGILASDKMATGVKDWTTFQQQVKDGNGDLYDVGDIVTDKWTDDTTEYDIDWRIDDNAKQFELADGSTVPGVVLESKYLFPFGVQFSHQQAFLACPGGLPAGTYHFTLGADWGNNAKKGKTYQFTTTKAVPNGGRIAGCYGMPDQAPANWKAYIFAANGIDKVEDNIAVTEGTGGTSLGTMAYDKHTTGISLSISGTTYTVDMNSMQETAYGHNRWRDSAIRQFMNSDKKKGLWWTSQNEFDIAPDQLATKNGMLCGMPADMLNAIRPVKVVTKANTVQDGGALDVTYDKFFLLSLEQMYINKQNAGEGEALEYYKELNGTGTVWPCYKDTPALIRYGVENKTAAQSQRLRSAYSGNAYYTWGVNPSGYVYGYSAASSANRLAPACVIC